MICILPGLYVVIEQVENSHAPRPLPLESGFSSEAAYLVLGGFSLSESGEMFFMLSNDHNEIWFISNRHTRSLKIIPNATQFRIPMSVGGVCVR